MDKGKRDGIFFSIGSLVLTLAGVVQIVTGNETAGAVLLTGAVLGVFLLHVNNSVHDLIELHGGD